MNLARSLWMVFILSTFILFGVFTGALLVSHSQDVEGVEQNVVYSLQRIIVNEELYTHPDQPPYNVVQYTPAYYGLGDVLASIFRIEATNIYGVYLLGRLISFSFGLGIYLIIWQLCKSFGTKGIILFTAMVFAMLGPLPWFLTVRPDSMMVFFEFLAIFFLIRNLQAKKERPFLLFAAGVALAFAFYSKQTAILFLGLFFLFPFYHHWLKARLALLGGFALGLFAAVLILLPYANVWPHNDNAFYLNVVGGVTNTTNIDRALYVYQLYLSNYFPFFLLPLLVTIFAALKLWKDGESNGLPSFWKKLTGLEKVLSCLLFLFWGSTGAAFVMSLKSASALNYFNESMLLGVLLLAYFLSHSSLPVTWRENKVLRHGMALLLFLSVFMIGNFLIGFYGRDAVSLSPKEKLVETLDILEAEFAEHPDDFFIYFPSLRFERWLNLYAFENTILEPREVYNVSYFDLSSLRTYLDDGRLRLFITDKTDFPQRVFGYRDMHSYFELWQETESHLIYRNRNSD